MWDVIPRKHVLWKTKDGTFMRRIIGLDGEHDPKPFRTMQDLKESVEQWLASPDFIASNLHYIRRTMVGEPMVRLEHVAVTCLRDERRLLTSLSGST